MTRSGKMMTTDRSECGKNKHTDTPRVYGEEMPEIEGIVHDATHQNDMIY